MPPFLLSDIFIEYFTVGFYKTVVQKQSFIIKQWCKALGWMCFVLVEILVNGVYILCVFYVQNANCFFFLLIFSIIFMSSFACASWCFYLWDWWDVRLYFCFVIIFSLLAKEWLAAVTILITKMLIKIKVENYNFWLKQIFFCAWHLRA